ncbi:MAG: Nucleotide-binding protein ExpZ [Eubacteriales bacterium SKADARSKE-1]|nr:Nucleotide-binding protein ExpZ [Eubacteriales bacterium SKADARSKE-1]
MATIDIVNLTFGYEGSYDSVFENVSFKIDTDWKLGFTGRNGRGKTTFLNLLLGKYNYSGNIISPVEFEYFPFEVKDELQNTIDVISEIIFIPDYEYWRLQRELSLLDVDENVLYRPFNTLSKGEQIKILLASLFLKEHCFLLIDEPTNHLDMKTRKIVSDYLKSKKGFILVSHDRKFLDNCIDHILSINKTSIVIQKGNFSSWHKNKQRQDYFELAKNEKLKRDIKRLEKSARQKADWSDKVEATKKGTKISGLRPDTGFIGHKAAKMMKRSKSIESKQQSSIEEKSKLLKDIETADKLKITHLKHYSSNILSFNGVSLYYGDKKICDNLNLEINQGDRIAICGKNGCGKSTILKFILGSPDLISIGNFQKVSNLKISYVSQDTAGLKGNLSDFATEKNIDESLFKAILRKLDFSRVQFEKDISDCSEGQKKKILIAKSLCEKAHLYLWDEPLNFIDILSRIQIEELILKSKPTILFVEHDKTFVESVATKIIKL